MEFEVARILFADKAPTPKIEAMVRFTETNKQSFAQSGIITVYLDAKDYTISELKAESIKAAKTLMLSAVSEELAPSPAGKEAAQIVEEKS